MLSADLLQKKIRRAQQQLGQNVVLDEIEETKEYKKFFVRIEKVFDEQIRSIVENDQKLAQLADLVIKSDASRRTFVMQMIDSIWDSFLIVYSSLFEGEDFLDYLLFAGDRGGQDALDKLEIDIDFHLKNTALISYFRKRVGLLITSVDDTTKKRLSTVIADGVEASLTNRELATLITQKFKKINAVRAEMIARTETANAVGTIQYATYQRNGVKRVRWITAVDERVCPICAPLHNQVVNIGGDFVVMDGEKQLFRGTRYPAHPDCRCDIEPVFDQYIDSLTGKNAIWTGE